jgi:hypothetical protein
MINILSTINLVLASFLACQHLSSGADLRESEDQSWFRFKRFLCFVLFDVRCFHVPLGVHIPRLKTTVLEKYLRWSIRLIPYFEKIKRSLLGHCSHCVAVSPLPLISNGSVSTFPRKRIQTH